LRAASLSTLGLAIVLAGTAAIRAAEPTDLYVKSYGDPKAPPLVFVHGGPGYNSVSFEFSTAEPLAREYYLTVYDQRGCGRSATATATATLQDYTFDRALDDLGAVIASRRLERPVLVGHSFGGAIALRYLDAHPERVRCVVLVGAPISYPDALANILGLCRRVYEGKNDAQGLAYLDAIERMPRESSEYAGYLFQHAIGCGLYAPQEPTPEARAIAKKLAKCPAAALLSDMKPQPFLGFIANEKYTTMSLWDLVSKHKDRVYGIYGREDWTLGDAGAKRLGETLPMSHLHLIAAASHGVFVDQQDRFIESVRATARMATRER
jgi:proline iminopeptidase